MNKKYHLIIFSVLFFVVGVALCLPAAVKGAEKEQLVTSGLEDQKGVAVTIYNVNLGLVKDQREIRLEKGTSQLRFMDVASQIIPSSVYIKSLSDPDGFRRKRLSDE